MDALKFLAIMFSIALICSRSVEATEDILIEQMDGIVDSVSDEHQDIGSKISSDQSFTDKLTVKKAFTTPSILLPLYSGLTAGVSLGFLPATLLPHLEVFPAVHLSSLEALSLFMPWAGSYYRILPVWDLLCDAPKLVELAGAVLISASFIVLGPLSLLPFQKTLTTITMGMVLHGAGVAASANGGLSDAVKSAIASGFPDTSDMYFLITVPSAFVYYFGIVLGFVVGHALYFSGSITFDGAIRIIVFMEVVSIALILFDKEKLKSTLDPGF